MQTGPKSGIHPTYRAVRLVLCGEVTVNDVVSLRQEVMRALENEQSVLINCSAATHFDADALQLLASLRVEARAGGVPIQIEGLPGSVLANAVPRDNVVKIADRRLAG